MVVEIYKSDELTYYSTRKPFNRAIDELQKNGLELIMANELAWLRLLNPIKIFRGQNIYVAELPIQLVNGDIVITRFYPIAEHPLKSVFRNQDEKEFYVVDEKILKEILNNAETNPRKAIKSGTLYIKHADVEDRVPVNHIHERPLTLYLFRDYAKPYGEILKANGSEHIHQSLDFVDHALNSRKPLAWPMLIKSFEMESSLNRYVDDTTSTSLVVGVKSVISPINERSSYVTSPNEILTLQQAADYLQISERTMLRLIYNRDVRASKVGGQWRLRRSNLEYLLDTNIKNLPNEPRVAEVESSSIQRYGSKNPISGEDEILTAQATAELLGMHVRTVYKHARKGRLPGKRIGGGKWRFSRSSIVDLIRGAKVIK